VLHETATTVVSPAMEPAFRKSLRCMIGMD
jgi:hypothetical protein